MNQGGVRCPVCGASEAAGTPFCGNCGARLDGGAGLTETIMRRPLLSAVLGGLGFSVVALLLFVVLGSGGGNSSPAGGGSNDGDSSLSADSAGQATLVAADEGETPEATAPAAADTPEASATPAPPTATSLPPSATPVPPTSTSVPPTATSAPPTAAPTAAPAIPAEKKSALVGLTVAGGHGSSHSIGEQVMLCYSSVANQYIRLLDFQPPGTLAGVIREGVDDGQGECLNGTIAGPAGYEVFRIEAWNSGRTSVVDYAELWIEVTP
jgi:hypothetical protein